MNLLKSVSIALAVSAVSAAAAAELDDSVTLACTGQETHDCLPGQKQCPPIEKTAPLKGQKPYFVVDFANKQIQSPYRTAVMPITTKIVDKEQIVLQGTDLSFAWSMIINRKTGKATATVADRQGAYVAFAQCKVEEPPKTQ
jgi:hypothetical protein